MKDLSTLTTEELNVFLSDTDARATEIMDDEDNEDNFLALKACKEVFNAINKAHAADCKFTLYANANAAKVWLDTAEVFLLSENI
jgi:hypothetical protein